MNSNQHNKACFLFSRHINNATTNGLRTIAAILDSKAVDLEDISSPDELAVSTIVLSDYGVTQQPGYSELAVLPSIMELRGDVVEYEYSPFLKSPDDLKRLIVFSNNLSVIVTPSIASRDKLIQAGIDESLIHVLRRGVDPELFNQDIENQQTPDILTLATVASLSWSKGHDRILATCTELKKQDIPFKWVLIGDGPNHEWLNFEITRLSLHEHVIPLWQLNPTQIQEQLTKCHFFVQMPYSDDLGYCAMEASALGVPLISTATGAIPEIYTHNKNSKLFNYQDAQKTAELITAAYKDFEICKALAQSTEVLIRDNFLLEHYASSYKKILILSHDEYVEYYSNP